MKTQLLLPIAILFLLAACQPQETVTPAPVEAQPVEAEAEPAGIKEEPLEEESTEIEEEPAEEAVEVEENQAEEERMNYDITPEEEEALKYFTEVYDGLAEVTFLEEDNFYMVHPKDEEMKEAIEFMVYGPPTGESWENFREHFASHSLQLDEIVGDELHAIVLMYPDEPREPVLGAMNGVIIYDKTKEK